MAFFQIFCSHYKNTKINSKIGARFFLVILIVFAINFLVFGQFTILNNWLVCLYIIQIFLKEGGREAKGYVQMHEASPLVPFLRLIFESSRKVKLIPPGNKTLREQLIRIFKLKVLNWRIQIIYQSMQSIKVSHIVFF